MPSESATARPGSRITVLSVVALAVLAASLSIAPLSTNDLFIHLETGERIVAAGSVPRTDPYSFTAAGHDYVAHEWLSAVLFYLVYAVAGPTGLVLFGTLIVLACWGLLFQLCRIRGDRLAAVLPAFGLMGYISAARYLLRPHLFSFLCAAALLLLLLAYRDGGRRRAWLLAVVPLQVLWTNLHGGFLLGILLTAAFAAGELLNYLLARGARPRGDSRAVVRDLPLVLGLPLLVTAASLINPYGYRLLLFPFQLTGSEIFMSEVFEWRPLFHDSFDTTLTFDLYWVWIVVLFVSIVASRRPGRLPGPPFVSRLADGVLVAALGLFAFGMLRGQAMLEGAPWLWIGLAVVFCAVNARRLDFAEVGIVALMFALSLRHNRGAADAVIVTLPILTRCLSVVAGRLANLGAVQRVAGARVVALLVPALLIEAGHVAIAGYHYDLRAVRERGVGLADTVPVCGADYVAASGLSGNAYVSYDTAAILIHSTHPRVLVNMDSRNDVYGAELFAEYRSAGSSYAQLVSYLEKYPVDFFFIRILDLAPAIVERLLQSGDWVQVYFDHQVLVLVRNEPAHRELIERDGYRFIFPGADRSLTVPAESAANVLAEAERAAAACPDSWLADWYRAQALEQLGRLSEAVEAGLQVTRKGRDPWYAWQLLGRLHARMRDRPRAIEAYDRAIAMRPDDEALRRSRQRLLDLRD